MGRIRFIVSIFIAVLTRGIPVVAGGDELRDAFDRMLHADLDTTTRQVVGRTISHEGVNLVLDSGRIAFLEPVLIDSTERYFGAVYEGRGRFQYDPRLRLEREQMRRFFDSDSLNRPFERALLFFSSQIHDSLIGWSVPSDEPFDKKQQRWFRHRYEELTEKENYLHPFLVLTGLVRQSERPYLMICVEPERCPVLIYWFDPDWSEEVYLSRQFWQPGVKYMETVSRYSQFAEERYPDLHGESKIRYRPIRYRTSGEIDRSGSYRGLAEVPLQFVERTRLMALSLHPELTVDSILDETGARVPFVRWKDRDYRSSALYLFLNRDYRPEEQAALEFYYAGKIAERFLGEFIVSAEAEWYPRTSPQPRVDFDMSFRTPKDFAFVATGRKVMSEVVEDTLLTRYRTLEPADNVTFTIGNMTRFDFGDDETGPIDIYYHKEMHRNRNRQKYVAEDVEGSIRLFEKLFGEYRYPRTTVSEIFAFHGQAFPGFIHLGHEFWETDTWGSERILRSHEVAHQWWGVGVDYLSYHDQWLSEGFATYSSLMYFQAAYGKEKFADKLRDYRDEIFDVRKYLFMDGAEAGPIIMGYRTSSSKTENDFDLIVYKKGAYVLHMLRNMLLNLETMNEDLFLRMMQEWYREWRGEHPSTSDFQALTEKYTGIDMDWFFQQWVYGTELPTYKFEYDVYEEPDGGFGATCRVRAEGVSEGFKMYLPVEVRFDQDRRVYARVLVDQLDQEFGIPGLPAKPKKIILNPFESVLCKVKQ